VAGGGLVFARLFDDRRRFRLPARVAGLAIGLALLAECAPSLGSLAPAEVVEPILIDEHEPVGGEDDEDEDDRRRVEHAPGDQPNRNQKDDFEQKARSKTVFPQHSSAISIESGT
jgi:hypothetical protein